MPVVIAKSIVSTYGLPVYETDDGIISTMVMSMFIVVLPPVLVAVIVYVVSVDKCDGVPLISPVDESMLKPFGRFGNIDHVKTGPPPTVGTPVVMNESLVSTKSPELYVIEDGTISLTVMSIVVVALPPVLLA